MAFSTNNVEIVATCDREMDSTAFDNFYGISSDGSDARNSTNCGTNASQSRGSQTFLKRGIETAYCSMEVIKNCGKKTGIVPMKGSRPMPEDLMDTAFKHLSDSEFMWLCKLEAVDLTPWQLMSQIGVHELPATSFMSHAVETTRKVSKNKARKIRRTNSKKA